MYNQLRYYSFLFNAEKAVKAAMGTSKLGSYGYYFRSFINSHSSAI